MDFVISENRIEYLKDDNVKAQLTFYKKDEIILVVDHVHVDSDLRGAGIADKLMLKFMNLVESENKKVIPVCSYATAWFEKHNIYKNYLA